MSHASRIKVPASSLNDSNRLRTDYSHVASLAESIRLNGLIQPIVITTDNIVVDGGSRLRACRDVLQMELVEVVILETLSEPALRMLEIEANIRRKDFTWSERVLGVARVHELQTTQSILGGSDKWTIKQTGELLGQSYGNVQYALEIARHLRNKDKEILACDGIGAALKLLVERKEAAASKRLAQLTVPSRGAPVSSSFDILSAPLGRPAAIPAVLPDGTNDDFYSSTIPIAPPVVDELPGQLPLPGTEFTIPLKSMLLFGDCFTHMEAMAPESVDHVITDIPYGIDMANLDQSNNGIGNIASVSEEHTVEGNVEMMNRLFPALFRITKQHSFCILWYDLSHHSRLIALATTAGFRVQRWPLVWYKTSPCINQAAQCNFTKNYEVALVLRKPGATLLTPQGSSVWQGGHDETRKMLDHPFVKPFKLWQWVMNAVAIKGQTVYDPFAGVGSSTLAAIQLGLSPITSEINEEHYNKQVLHVSSLYKEMIPGVKFV